MLPQEEDEATTARKKEQKKNQGKQWCVSCCRFSCKLTTYNIRPTDRQTHTHAYAVV